MYPLSFLRNSLPDKLSLNDTKPHVRFRLTTTNSQIKQTEIDFLVLHIENHTNCDIVNHWLDTHREILNIIFKSPRGLRNLPSLSHYLIASTLNSINDDRYFRRNDRLLIVTNVHKDSEQYLTIFIKNLDPENQIVQYFESKLLSNTFFVEFRRRINFELLEKRNKQKEILTRQRFHLMPAYHTNAVVMKYRNKQLKTASEWSFNKYGVCVKNDCAYVFGFKSKLGMVADNGSVDGLEDVNFEMYENCYNLDLVASKVAAVDEKLLWGLIDEQEGRLNHYLSQYFPIGYFVWIYVVFFVNLVRVYFKK